MEYIQCPNCLKKYGVNEKIRAASGKAIRCKGCQESFEIAIYSTPEPEKSESETKSETSTEANGAEPNREQDEADVIESGAIEEQQSSEEEPEKKDEPAKKQSFQMIYTVVLGVILLIALTAAALFQFMPELFDNRSIEKAQQKTVENKSVVSKKIAPPTLPTTEPMKKEPATGITKETTDGKATAKPETPPTVSRASSQDPINASDDCKQAATEQWFTDYMMTHGNISGNEYIRMLDESSSHTERVRVLCKDKYLASRISEAAAEGEKPAWIEADINARTGSQYDGSANTSRW